MVLTDVDKIFYGMPELRIVKSETDDMELSYYSRARGSNKLRALERAEKTEYPVQQRDSSLFFVHHLHHILVCGLALPQSVNGAVFPGRDVLTAAGELYHGGVSWLQVFSLCALATQ